MFDCPSPDQATGTGLTICASDNRNYATWCDMQAEACRSGVVIETKHMGLCAASKYHIILLLESEA